MQICLRSMAIITVLGLSVGCHRNEPPHATAADIKAAQTEAQKEIAAARVEASKDVKSAAKIAGSGSHDVAQARAEGSFDIAMAKADGEHNVATEKCLTLEAGQQQSCKNAADAVYETATAAAKSARLAHRQ